MDNCNKSCSDCKSELSAILCDVPSKWREQIVSVICNTVTNYGVCCTDVLTCIKNELDTLDYSCLAESAAEWEAYSFLQKIQVIIDKVCENAGSGPDFDASSSSLVITPGGPQGHEPTIELVPSTDSNNILVLGGDGKPYVPAQNTPVLVANDSTSINFTTSGTAGHTLTGVVILDSDSDNAIINTGSGLFVDKTLFEVPLSFNNALTRTSNLVQLGGNLIKDTTIGLNTKYLYFNGSNGSNVTFAPNETWIYQSLGTSIGDAFTYAYTLPNYSKIVGGLLTGSPSYLSAAYFKADNILKQTTLGSNFPNTDDTLVAAPSLNPILSSYLRAKTSEIEAYANKMTFTSPTNTVSSGALVTGRKYIIKSNGGGADFTPAGAANNTVGTTFIANGVTPTWGSGSLKLIGEFRHNTDGVSVYQDDSNFVVTATDSNLIAATATRPNLTVSSIIDYTAYNSGSYYAIGQIAMNAGNLSAAYTKIGHYIPDTNDPLVLAPSVDANKTSYTTYSEGLIVSYGKEQRFEGQLLVKAQGAGGSVSSSAILELSSTTKGFRLPVMTSAQKLAISSPVSGLMIYQTDASAGVHVYDGSTWRRLNWT